MNETTIYNLSRKDLIKLVCERYNIEVEKIKFTSLSTTGLKIGV